MDFPIGPGRFRGTCKLRRPRAGIGGGGTPRRPALTPRAHQRTAASLVPARRPYPSILRRCRAAWELSSARPWWTQRMRAAKLELGLACGQVLEHLRREGDIWIIVAGGVVLSLRHVDGLDHPVVDEHGQRG